MLIVERALGGGKRLRPTGGLPPDSPASVAQTTVTAITQTSTLIQVSAASAFSISEMSTTTVS